MMRANVSLLATCWILGIVLAGGASYGQDTDGDGIEDALDPLLVVYYSGHAGPGGLGLGAERVSFDELKALVAASSADAKVVVVDACEAGALTQVKGAKVAPAVDFPLPTGDEVRGTAFVASTAVGEAAQESAALGGSFFTHHLDVALRGAGDADDDGLVTLAEAFRYTSARTVTATAATAHGPQHVLSQHPVTDLARVDPDGSVHVVAQDMHFPKP